MSDHALYVNTKYNNYVSMDETIADSIGTFGAVTWRTLLGEILHEDLSPKNLDSLLENYGLNIEDLDVIIDAETVSRYYNDIEQYVDNVSGPMAKAFELLLSLELFPMDKWECGDTHGVSLCQQRANGAKKLVAIDGEDAAEWLRLQLQSRGLNIDIKFV